MARGRNKELVVNTGLFAISSFGSKLISFLMLPLYTAVLSTGDYGTVDLINSTVSLLVPLLTLNVQDAVLRYGLGMDAEPEEILSVGLRMVTGGSCVLLVLLVVVHVLGVIPIDGTYLAFLLIMFVLTALSNVITMYVKSQDQVRSLVVSGIGNTFVMCISAVVLLVVVKAGVVGYMISMALGSLFVVIYLFFAGKLWHGVTVKVRTGLLRSMVAFSAPLVANSLAWWTNDVSDRYVVTLVCGAAANGIYAVAYKIPSILSTLQSVFYNAWAISAVKEFDAEDKDGFLGRTYELYSGAMAICCSVIMLINIPLATFLYANEFFEAWRFVPALLVGTLLYGLALFEGCLFTAARNTKAVSTTTLAGAATSIASCIILTITIGPIGAAIATFLGYLVTWVTRTWVMLDKVVRLKVSWRTEVATLVVLLLQALVAMRPEFQFVQFVLVVLVFYLRRRQLGSIWAFVKDRLSRS
ncbi:MAG: oligosaccharide flippase family protein [Olsenella sp.]|jgi:O-antigen/teichoic acid export membrane protein